MKHTLAAARAVAARRSTTGPHAPYMLIVYALAEKINSGELKSGDRMPSVTELVGTHNVSPSTARRALAKLKEMSLTDTVPGYATFVRFADVESARQTAEGSSATGSAVRRNEAQALTRLTSAEPRRHPASHGTGPGRSNSSPTAAISPCPAKGTTSTPPAGRLAPGR